MIGYNFGLGSIPGPFCFGALSEVVRLSLRATRKPGVECGPRQAVSFLPDRP